MVIDDLSNCGIGSRVRILYYYYDFTDQRTLHMRDRLGSLLKQPLQYGYADSWIEDEIISSCGDETRSPTEKKLMDLLYHVLQSPGLFLVVNRFDKCERLSQGSLVQFWKHLPQLSNVYGLKVLVTCRDEDPLLQSLSHYLRIPIWTAALTTDIALYIKFSVRQRIESKELRISNPVLELEIIDELIAKAQGMFVMACKLYKQDH